METIPATPPLPVMGILTVGFLFLSIYVLVKISDEGEGRYIKCKKVFFLGALGMFLVVFLEFLRTWGWNELFESPTPSPVWLVSLAISLPIILVVLLDIIVQRVGLK